MSDEITDLVAQTNGDKMSIWDDNKKKDFVSVFKNRVDAAKYVLTTCASNMLHAALQKKFVGTKHSNKFNITIPYHNYGNKIGGREQQELIKLADDRAKDLLKSLPPLSKAVQIISPELSKKIEERDGILEKGKALAKQLADLSEPIHMSEKEKKMTIGSFRKMVKDTEKKRNELAFKMNELGKEGCELEDEIDKALYAGIPGLSDAVCNAVQSCLDKSNAFDQMSRRVEEKVLFGDSQTATEIFRKFEQDESKLSDDVKAELTAALDKLGVGKQLKGKVKNKKK